MGRYFPNRTTEILQASVINIDMVQWTVDVYSKKVGRWFPNVQVGNMYLHHAAGEGVYAVPDLGATCMICLPTDLSPPFILSYVAPPEVVSGDEVDNPDEELAEEMAKDGDALDQADSSSRTRPLGFTFGLRRGRAKPGDIVMRGRDGNFVILHRGGVLQLGASELAQRIYLPLRNLITDMAERYRMTTAAGTIRWGMQELDYEKRETEWMQTLRVFADDAYADLRIVCGHVNNPVRLPEGDDDKDILDQMQFAVNAPVVYEVTLLPGGKDSGFNAESGEVYKKSYNQMKLQWKFDRDGKAYGRFDGDAFLSCQKNLFVRVKGNLDIQSKGVVNLTGDGNATLGGKGTTKVKGQEVILADGALGVARMADQVAIVLPPSLAGQAGLPVLYGSIITSSAKVKVP